LISIAILLWLHDKKLETPGNKAGRFQFSRRTREPIQYPGVRGFHGLHRE